ncbi:MAG TPA: ABC transporter ATP-binding protein [Chloroflexota bacterium]
MPAITFDHVTKVFESGAQAGDTTQGRKAAVHDVSFEVEEGEFVVLLGPSGCGKTTLMRMVNRLIEPTSGRIEVDGREIHDIPATHLRRQIGYVIQQVGLFPHMRVEQNIAVVPKLLGWPKERIDPRIDELLELVALPPEQYRKRYPRQLSGGQQQRVGIARAMAADPDILLMDEPFGAIDAITRTDLQNELLAIQRKVSKTVIFVTHDVEEALRLADRIAVMREGEVVQFDAPVELLTHPADDFVRALLGTQDVFRQLSLVPVMDIMEPVNGEAAVTGLTVGRDGDVRGALSTLIANSARELTVVDNTGKPVGRITLQKILDEGAHEAAEARSDGEAG